MKKIVTLLIAVIIVLGIINVVHVNNKQRISKSISDYIISNIHQLSNLYENMYSDDEPNRYFESSIINAINICDKIEEEFVFYYTIYPKRDMFLEYLIDDYKLLLRIMKNNPDMIKEAIPLHKELNQYLSNYVSVDYSNNSVKTLYKTDKAIKINDKGNWHLIHDKVVKLSKR